MKYKAFLMFSCLCCFGWQLGAQDYREIYDLFGYGMNVRAGELAYRANAADNSSEPEGLAVLAAVKMNVRDYSGEMSEYIEEHPYSTIIPQLRYYHACNLFNASAFTEALEQFSMIREKQLYKSQRREYKFRKAYCLLELKDYSGAAILFSEVEKMPVSDFTAPSRYALGCIAYEARDFRTALGWFEKASKDRRFEKFSSWYVMECNFLLKNYDFVIANADAMSEIVPDERKTMLTRLVSEAYLVKGNAEKAKEYYDRISAGGEMKSDRDWFYSGSVLYAVGNYKDAIASFNNIADRSDSLGQIANYQLGDSYLQVKNKVAALDAFKLAAAQKFDPEITEDAFFNYAKLSFDINHDTSIFYEYLKTYSDRSLNDKIYGYIAVAALYDRDYEAAVAAFDKIEELADDMRSNYMKTNYMRAKQLMDAGSYRKAVPCLKAAAYYAPKSSGFHRIAKYYLGEAYHRNGQYELARQTFTELYNVSALSGSKEAYLLPYNIAYTYFMQEKYTDAIKWFDKYIVSGDSAGRKDAMERKADCVYATSGYGPAEKAYDALLDEYFSPNDIYPYYQSAVLAGLQNKTDKKISLLSNVLDASPSDRFYAEALFELGRSYALQKNEQKALDTFNYLIGTVKDSSYIAKSYIEMGSVLRNRSSYDEALEYYKKVVEKFPSGDSVDDALLAIESIYQTKNEPQKYFEYVAALGKGGEKTEEEKENMYFDAAEQIYLSENYDKAVTSLSAFLKNYPSSPNVYKADFYLAESYKHLGRLELARDFYAKVMEHGEGSFAEMSRLNFAEISYRLEHWNEAYSAYSSLLNTALLESNGFIAKQGMMRAAYRGHDWNAAVAAADVLMSDSRTGEVLMKEAMYMKAKSLMANSRRNEAFALFTELAKDMATPYGAEAAYILIVAAYDEAEYETVKDRVFAFSDSRTPQLYWLAKSFVVLGDVFAEQGDFEQAKATFESVRDGYSPAPGDPDDLADNIRIRLERLNEMNLNMN